MRAQTSTPGAQSQRGPEVQPSAPKRITAAIRGDPRTLSDSVNFVSGGSSSAGVIEIEQLLNAGLLLVDGDGALRPLISEAAPTVENGFWKLLPDGRMETTLRIRPNVQWHDGTAFTADDIVFSAKVLMDKSIPISQDILFRYIDRVEALDARTVVAHWKGPFIGADRLLAPTGTGRGTRNVPMPKHLLDPAYEEDRASFTQSPYFGQTYVGTGPYRLQDWVLGSHLVLEANDRYVLGRPKIDQIHVRFILDTNTMVSNVLAGALDLTLGRGLNPEQAILVRSQWADGKVDAGLQNTTALRPQFLNSEPALLSTDVRFRRALLHAIDRQQIVDAFLAGFVPIAHSNVSPEEPIYRDVEPVVVRYAHDPRRSVALLQEIGLARGPDGTFLDASGQRLAVEIRTRAHDLREKLQQVIAAEWQQIGVVGEPVVVPEQRISDRVYQATYPGFYFRFGGPEVDEYHSAGLPLPENNFTGANFNRYRNAEMDVLIDRYVTTIPKAERTQAYVRIIQHLTDQLVLLTLYHEPEPVLVGNRLVNAAGRRGDAIQTWNAHEWDVRS